MKTAEELYNSRNIKLGEGETRSRIIKLMKDYGEEVRKQAFEEARKLEPTRVNAGKWETATGQLIDITKMEYPDKYSDYNDYSTKNPLP